MNTSAPGSLTPSSAPPGSAPPGADETSRSAVAFSVASFNVRWGYAADNTPFDLTAVCRQLDADIVALQEVWEPDDGPGQGRRAAETLGYELFEAPLSGSNVRAEPRITRHHHETDGWWGTALLSRLPLRSPRTVDLGRAGGRVDLAHRQAIVAAVQVGAVTVGVAVVHLSFFWPSTLAQVWRLRAVTAASLAGPMIVVGDFNLPAALVRAAFGRAGGASPAAGWTPAVRGRTFPAHRPVVQLDHLLVRGGDLAVVNGSVLPASGSDHRPIRAKLRSAGVDR